jgi:hypothetical protein
MKRLYFTIAVVMAVTGPVSGQSKKAPATTAAPQKPTGPRTPWGDPDLQGLWNDATSTPLQRPNGVGAKDVLSDEEASEFQEQLAADLSLERRDGAPDADVNRGFNEHWDDARRLKITEDHRTALIVEPPDGRIPALVPLSPEREKAAAERRAINARFNAGFPESYLDMAPLVRCIIRTDAPPYLPTIYNNDFQIFQSPGYVVIAPEMIHSARIIPVSSGPGDARTHIGKNLLQWLGDSRGHWEGETLVVETTNFRHDNGVVYRGADPATFKITERFTRVDAKRLTYEFTVSDPATWTRPWTARVPWNRIDPDELMYEYACHEDNYDMAHFLSAARAREKAPAKQGNTVTKGETK